MRKRLFTVIALVLVCVTAFACASCGGSVVIPDNKNINQTDAPKENVLRILDADFNISAEQKMSRIKSEYLIENNGYKPDDEVVAILSLGENALIDTYLDGEGEGDSVADYAASKAGKAQFKEIKAQQNALVKKLKKSKLIDSVEYNYSTVLNAVAVKTVYGNISDLENFEGVESVYLSDTYNRPMATEGGTVENLVENLVDVYETGIFNSSSVKYTGKNTAVAVLDSGFDCSHSVFDHNLKSDELWIKQSDIAGKLGKSRAAEFTPDLKLSDVWYSNKIPFAYDYADKDSDVFPYDSEHGTHVAGIIGGKDDVITGVAVDTQLVLLKVFPDLDDGAKTEDILAGLEDAVLLEVDAINMSLGSSCGFAREADGDPINVVYDKINASGISLLTAASNSYSSGYGGEQGNTNLVTNPDSGTVGSPSTYAAALSVASISGTKSRYLVGNDSQVVFFLESNSVTGDPNDFVKELYASLGKQEGETLEIGYVTVPGVGLRVNYSSIRDEIKGKIALVRRGDSTFEDKALQAKNAGAVACIIYNNVDGDINMSMGKTDHIPTISISKDDGTILASRASGTITVKYSNQAGPFMSDFSSWGPSPNLELKPEITAHGGDIRSSVPGGGYDNLSGTSMATPNLCGIVVLIRQFLKDEYPDLKTKEISVLANQLMMSTATVVLNEQGNPYSPRKQGAGLASLYNVVNTRAYLTVDGKDRSKIELWDDPERNGVYEMDFNVVNVSDSEIKYDFSLVGMTESVSTSDATHVSEKGQLLTGGYTLEASGSGSVDGDKVTVSAGGTLKLHIVYTLTDGDKQLIDSLFPYGMYVEGFCKLTAQEENDIDLNIPFLAFYGDWTQAPMFDKTFYEVESEAHNAAIDDEDKIKADYYATTPYGSYYYNYIMPLGSYLYDLDENIYDPIPASEEHIAISDQLTTIDGISAVYGGLLRGAKKMDFSITEKSTGEVIWSDTDYNANKAYSVGGTPVPYYNTLNLKGASSIYSGTGVRDSKFLGLKNNTEYEFKMQGTLDYGEDGGISTNARNTFSFDFTADTESPIIKSAEYEKTYDRTLKKDRYYVTLTVYDNQYVQSVSPVTFPASDVYTYRTQNPIPVYGDKASDSRVRIEITDYLNDLYSDELINNAIAFYIDDYALNGNIFLCQLPGTRGAFKFTSDGTMNGVELQAKSINQNEVFDLTSLLATADSTVDENKDYLKYLTWVSANEDIAVVEKGQVRGIRPGRTTVTAIERLNGLRASIIINVRKSGQTASETSALADEGNVSVMSLQEAQALSSQAAVMGGGREASALSENHVDNAADATIDTLRFTYFETQFAYSRAAQTSEIGETGSRYYVSALNGSVSFYPGESIKLFYDLQPWYVADKYPDLTWSSTNNEIVKVEQDGTVTALKKGSATVSLSVAGSNLRASLRITVNSEFVIENRMLVAYKGLGGHVEIPDDEGILYIGAYAFCLYDTDRSVEINEDDYDANKIPKANTAITSVTIPEGVEDIQKYAFYNCSSLETVSIPDSVKYIREYAFYGDLKLKNINLGKVETIGANAFRDCAALATADLGKAFAIGREAFGGSGLTSANLTALRNTGARAFTECKKLESVTLGANTKLSVGMFADSGLKSVDVYERVSLPDMCFMGCESLVSATIHNPLVSIGAQAFDSCKKLQSVAFEGAVGSFGQHAFSDCEELASVTLPSGEVDLDHYVFRGCKNLTEVVFGKDTVLSSVGGAVMHDTGVTTFRVGEGNDNYSVSADGHLLLDKSGKVIVLAATGYEFGDYTIGASIERIGEGAFSGAQVTSLTVASKDLIIGDYAFAENGTLEKLILPAEKGVKIGAHAFNGSALKEITNLEFAASIGEYAFANTSKLDAAHIGAGITLNEGAFYRSGIKKLTLESGVQVLDAAARDCKSLTTVEMKGGNIHIGDLAFYDDTSLATIDLSKTDNEIGESAFYHCIALAEARMDNVTVIGDYAFADCSMLATVTFPRLKTLGEGVFALVRNNGVAPIFQAIDLPDTLETIGEGAFLGCGRLSSVVIPDGITEIPDYAFALCPSLTRVTLPASVVKIGDYAFRSCGEDAFGTAFAINLGNVKTIGDNAFENATYLGYQYTVDLAKVETVGERAFFGTRLDGNIVASALRFVGKDAFNGAYFSSLTAPVLETISEGAFRGNRTVTEFVLSDKIANIERVAFQGCTNLRGFYFGTGAAKTNTAVINEYAKIKDGVLYTAYAGGGWQLTSVPAALNTRVLEVERDTTRIDTYAGNANRNIRSLVFPESLKIIGDYAFYGYAALRDVEFRSVVAPTLESLYNYNGELIERYSIYDNGLAMAMAHPLYVDWYSDRYALDEIAPGYELLHNQFDIFASQSFYYTFKDLAGAQEPILLMLPSNENLYGYDTIIYEAFFGKVSEADRSSYVARDRSFVQFVEYAEKIAAKDTILIADETLINNAVIAYNAVTQDPTEFGYTSEEWAALVKCVTDARATITEIKIRNASLAVRSLQTTINSLPTVFTESVKDLLDSVTAKISMLRSDERMLLDLTNYNALMSSYEAWEAHRGEPEKPKGLSTGALVAAIVVPIAVVLVAGGTVLALWLMKRKKNGGEVRK